MAGRIEDYAIIGDMQTAALVGVDGSIDWLCLPRFDSGACFAALLGTERHGHWRIAPTTSIAQARGGSGMKAGTRAGAVSRRYRGDTLVLETRWETASGTARVIDFMPPRDSVHPLAVVRIVEGVHGTVEMDCTLRMRFDYGHVVPWVQRSDGRISAAGPRLDLDRFTRPADRARPEPPRHLHGQLGRAAAVRAQLHAVASSRARPGRSRGTAGLDHPVLDGLGRALLLPRPVP